MSTCKRLFLKRRSNVYYIETDDTSEIVRLLNGRNINYAISDSYDRLGWIFGIIFGGRVVRLEGWGFVYFRPRLRKEDSEADKAKHDAKMADLLSLRKAYQIIDKLQEELQERTKDTLELEKFAHQNSLKLNEHEQTISDLGRDVKLQSGRLMPNCGEGGMRSG